MQNTDNCIQAHPTLRGCRFRVQSSDSKRKCILAGQIIRYTCFFSWIFTLVFAKLKFSEVHRLFHGPLKKPYCAYFSISRENDSHRGRTCKLLTETHKIRSIQSSHFAKILCSKSSNIILSWVTSSRNDSTSRTNGFGPVFCCLLVKYCHILAHLKWCKVSQPCEPK